MLSDMPTPVKGRAAAAACLGGATFVAVVQAAHLGKRHDLACTGWLDRSKVRRVLAEREVRARAVVVGPEPAWVRNTVLETSTQLDPPA